MVATTRSLGRGLWALLVLLAVVYALAVPYLLLGWAGVQSLPTTWQRQALPLYALACALGAISAAAILKRRRWGVYGLALTWCASATLNSIFGQPGSPAQQYASLLLPIVFFLLLLPAWQHLE